MANPFDLTGPAFLLFYSMLGIAVNLLLRWLVLGKEREDQAAARVCTDPYKLASLRAGASETLRVVLVSLIDRGLLKATGAEVKAEKQAAEMVRKPVERAVANFFKLPRQAGDLFADPICLDAGNEYCRELATEGLMVSDAVRERRRGPVFAALLLMLGVSGTKILIALSRGRHNILFLIILTLIFSVWTLSTWRRKRTGAGDEVLRRARLKFASLKERAESIRPGGMTNDASLLAALFGVTALPSLYFPYVTTLFPQASTSDGSGSGSGCGGGGCGGGGCGGGCGGCGG